MAADSPRISFPAPKPRKSALDTEAFDLVIADIGLPRQDGLQLVRSLRSRGQIIPMLILTARDGLEDRVTALDLGADDYLTKPFQVPELLARCRALIRRANSVASARISLRRPRARHDAQERHRRRVRHWS